MITLRRVRADDDDFNTLITELDSELRERYGETQIRFDGLNRVPEDAHVVVAYNEKEPAGCGCFKSAGDGVVELKRMFVRHSFRGRGISKLICGELEKWAVDLRYQRIILETGVRQPEAISLYESVGFRRIGNYGEYQGNGMSVCMEKVLLL